MQLKYFITVLLYIGRLDNLTEPEHLEIVKDLEDLAEPELIPKFHSILLSIGYSFPSPVSLFSVEKVYEYGRELALHKLCEEIDFIYFQLHEWYSRSKLPFFLKLPSENLTYDVVIRALDYLQPENTIPMQVALYENIRRVHGYECKSCDCFCSRPEGRTRYS